MDKKAIHMDIDLFKKLIREIDEGKRIKIHHIDMWNGGETLMHPRFKEFMKIIGTAKTKNKKFPRVRLLTNAALLHEENASAILDNDAVDCIWFSVDGRNKDQFESIRRGAKFEHIRKNIRCFLEMNRTKGKNIRTGIISIQPDCGEVEREFKELYGSVTDYMPNPLHDWDGSSSVDIAKMPIPKGRCHFIIRRVLVINADGYVTPCCADINERGIIGDYKKQDLISLLHSDSIKKMTYLLKKNRRSEIELCKNCSVKE